MNIALTVGVVENVKASAIDNGVERPTQGVQLQRAPNLEVDPLWSAGFPRRKLFALVCGMNTSGVGAIDSSLRLLRLLPGRTPRATASPLGLSIVSRSRALRGPRGRRFRSPRGRVVMIIDGIELSTDQLFDVPQERSFVGVTEG